MKSKFILVMMLMSSVLAFSGCSDDDDDDAIKMDNQTFVNAAASGNMLEIQAGAMAEQKGQNQLVKQYGHHMVTDHTEASTQLATLASNEGFTVPTQLMEKHQTQLNALMPLTGTAFDKAFMNLMVLSHQEQVSLFEQASNSVEDDDLRGFAAQKLPVLKTHLQEAQQLNATVSAQ